MSRTFWLYVSIGGLILFIVNYAMYRDFKTAAEMRAATAERVRKYRARKKKIPPSTMNEDTYCKIARTQGVEAADQQFDRMQG